MKIRDDSLDTISFSVSRDFSDDFVEVAVEVLDYHPADKKVGWGCEKFDAYVELGRAWYLDGKECVLTPLESEAAQEAALKQIENDIEQAIFDRDRG